jgi:hypothetical protein
MTTHVDSAADHPEGLVFAVYTDDRKNKPISIKQAALDYKSWRELHYKTKITWR